MSSSVLFQQLCAVGNALEDVRDTTLKHGAMWIELDIILDALDKVIDQLVVDPPARSDELKHWRQDTRRGNDPPW